MKRILIVVLCSLMFFSMSFSIVYADGDDTDFYTEDDDYVQLQTENDHTLVNLKDDVLNSKFIYGSEDEDYKVDISSFVMTIKLLQIEKNGRFVVTFAANRDAVPLNGEVEGISFVFRLANNGEQIEIAILDAKNGELIDEMKGVQWSYLGSAENNYNNGVIGAMAAPNNSVKGSDLVLRFGVDSASSGGTTFRPQLGSSLGVAIPQSLFDARGLNKKSLTLIITTGEKDTNYNFADGSSSTSESGEDLVLRLSKINEANTTKYNDSITRRDIIGSISSYILDSTKLSNAELSLAEYTSLMNRVIDLDGLRTSDKQTQQKRIDEANLVISAVGNIIDDLINRVNDYLDKNNQLSNLNIITENVLNEAKAARDYYEEVSVFKKYLDSGELAQLNNVYDSINKTYILRAELDIELREFESIVSLFSNDINNADIDDVIAAMKLHDKLDVSLFNNLDSSDALNFNNRYDSANNALNSAMAEHQLQVEKRKIEVYNDAVNSLDTNSSISDYQEVIGLRPTLNTNGLSPTEKNEVIDLFAAANDAFKALILQVLEQSIDEYEVLVEALTEREDITREAINTALDNKYDDELLDEFIVISNILELDLNDELAVLYELDRRVIVAEMFLLVNLYSEAINNVAGERDLETAYNLRTPALIKLDDGNLTVLEKDELSLYLDDADLLMNNKAKTYIDERITTLEASLEKDLSLNVYINQAKAALKLIPNLKYLTFESDYISYSSRLDSAYLTLKEQDLYYFTAEESSSWSAQSTNKGVLLSGSTDKGTMNLEEALDIDGLDMVFDYTKIGRIWAGEVDGKYPQNILVVNFMRDYGKVKDNSQGFSIYLNPNILGELEVMIYGADRDGSTVLLSQGKVTNLNFDDPNNPVEIRIRISKVGSPLNAYQIWINSLRLNVYYRDFINFDADSPLHLPEFEEGSEVGENIFADDKANVAFVLFGESLTPEEENAQITVKKLNDKTFAGYVAPILPIEMIIDSEPDKLEYYRGEELDLTGLAVSVVMSDGSIVEIDQSLLTITGFSSNTLGTKIVSVIFTHEGITLTKVIRLSVIEEVVEPTPNSNKGDIFVIIGASLGGLALLGAGLFIFLKKKK